MSDLNQYGKTPELTKELYQDFVERLKADHDDGFTSDPIFHVEYLDYGYGIDADYGYDGFKWVSVDGDEVFDNDEDAVNYIFEEFNREYHLDEIVFESELCDMDGEEILKKVYYRHSWKRINAHLTRKAAENFILRKKHDYGKMRVWTDSQYWCPEFKAIIKAMIDGKLEFNNA